MSDNVKKILKIILNTIFIALIVVSIIIVGLFTYFKVCYTEAVVVGPSMYPTLNSGAVDDVVAINKNASFTYGDIVTATSQKKDANGNNIVVIKRVIALAGDYVDIKFNENDELIVLVNNEELEEPYIETRATRADSPLAYLNWQEYKVAVGSRYEEGKGLLILDNEVFLMGDNRIVSNDSTAVGPFKVSSVQGRVEFVLKKGENVFLGFLKNKIFNR